MGGKSGSSEIEVNRYLMSMHVGICLGPVDAITAAYYGEKRYWVGYATENMTLRISKTGLFGGNKKEGGIEGNMHLLLGKSDQVLPDALARKLGRAGGWDAPGFRGVTSVFHTGPASGNRSGWYWAANSPYLKSMWYTVINIPKSLDTSLARIGSLHTGRVALFFCLDDSASMATNNRFGLLKNAMSVVIENLKQSLLGNSGQLQIDIGVSWFNGGVQRYTKASVSDLDALNSWIQGWTWSGGTDFDAAITPAVDFFTSTAATNYTRRVNLFVTDGLPEPVSSANAARSRASALLNRTIPVDMHGINIDLVDTTYTAYLDNTAQDGVPVVSSDDASALVNAVMTAVFQGFEANPAHIIYEVLTNDEFGMGLEPAVSVNIPSFMAAAQTLFYEQLGLSMAWSTTTPAETFIDDVLNHINAVTYPDPENDGKITLKLIRDDYNVDDLRVVNPDNANLVSFSRKAWGDTINEIVVTWTNPENEQEETITLQDNGNIAEQGEVISDSKNYYGVRSASLAMKLAERDLRVASSPLCSAELELDRSFWNLKPGDCIKLTWPDYGITELVMRVWEVKYGSGKKGSGKITANVTEDIFGLPVASFVAPPSSEWFEPAEDPVPITKSRVITLPVYIASKLANASASTFEYPQAFAGVLGAPPNADTGSFDLVGQAVDPTGAVVWELKGTRVTTSRGSLKTALVASATSFVDEFELEYGEGPDVAMFILIGDDSDDKTELALIMRHGDQGWEISRGVLDTVPRDWPAGTPVWFLSKEFLFADYTQQSAGSNPLYKLLTNTSLGQLSESLAPVVTGTLSDRMHLPLRPANVKVDGVGFGEVVVLDEGEVSVTWARRNRLMEETVVLAWDSPDVTPESGQTTTVRLIDDATNSVLHEVSGLTGVSTTVSNGWDMSSDQVSKYFVEVLSDVDGLTSLQGHRVALLVVREGGYGIGYGLGYGVGAEPKLLSKVLAVAHEGSPYISTYPFDPVAGYGVRYANPATPPSSTGFGCAFNSDRSVLAVAHSSSPYISTYPFDPVAGYGVRYANPATPPSGTGQRCAFNSDGSVLAVAHSSSPYISTYPFDPVAGYGVRYANPATPPSGTGWGCAFNSDGSVLAVAHSSSPCISTYPFDPVAGYGVRYADPATLPLSNGYGCAFNSDGSVLAVAHRNSPYISTYPFDPVAGYGVRYADPATPPPNSGYGCTFNSDGSVLAVVTSSSPYISTYPFDPVAGYGVRYANPATPPSGAGQLCAFNSDGSVLAVAHEGSPYISTYPFDPVAGYGVRYANPAIPPSHPGYGCAFD